MFTDIVVPQGNLPEFITMAERLGFARLIVAADTPKIVHCTAADMRATFENSKDAIIVVSCRLDQVACSAAVRNNSIVCFPLGEVLAGNPANTIWNIKLCRKYKVKAAIASFAKTPLEMRAPRDVLSLFTCLGMEPGAAKKALGMLQNI